MLSQIGLGGRLPVILQIESSECGLACLAMIAAYHGYKIDLATLRQRFSISRKGATLESLVRIARGLRLECRPLRLEMEYLHQLQLPCVVHWDMNHFVVLKTVTPRRVVVHDPAVGERVFTREEAAKHFTGVALECMPSGEFVETPRAPKFGLRNLLGKVSGLKRSLMQILVLALAMEIVVVAMPFQLQWVVDQVLVSADRDLLTVIGIGFILLMVIQVGIHAVRSWFVVSVGTHMAFQWMGNVFAHLMKLPLEYFEKRHVGHIVSCFDSLSHVQETLTFNFVQTVVDGFLVVGTLGVMFLYSPKLTLIAVAAVCCYLLLRWSIFRALREATAEQIVHTAKQQTYFMESTNGIQSVRLFGRGEERRIGWMNLLADQFNAGLRIHRLNISYETANKFIFGVERILIIWLAAIMVMDSRFTAGMLFAFIAYKEQFSQRVSDMINRLFDLVMLRLHLDRVVDIVGTETEVIDTEDEVDASVLPKSVELKALSFRYAPTEDDVIRGVDLTINEGECVAITGISGSGKTTLVKVLLGLLTPTSGEVCLGGVPILRLGLNNYRNLIGTVMQEDRLFTGSIADNIGFFCPDRDDSLIAECARLAAIHDEILAMPMGYNTLVGDTGLGISGGQKQRILLARALYRKPCILVLDEATSHLDVINELQVNDSIKKMRLTRIIIAHRQETIAMADRVVLMEGGEVSEVLTSENPLPASANWRTPNPHKTNRETTDSKPAGSKNIASAPLLNFLSGT